MKKISIAINCLLIGVILFQACSSSKVNTGNAQTTNPCSRCNEYSRADLEGMISYADAVKLSAAYISDSGKKFIGKGAGLSDRQDTRNVWFSLSKLKAFIGYIEQQACLSGCEKSKRLGIRVYFAKYPGSDNTSLGALGIYQNHHTVFFSATYYDRDKNMNIDFDPAHVTKNCGFRPIHDLAKDSVFMFVPAQSPNQGDQQNHGDIAPPPDGRGSFPTVPQ